MAVILVLVGVALVDDGRREVDTEAIRGSGPEAGTAARLLDQLTTAITEGDRGAVDDLSVGGALSHLVPNAQLLRVRDLDMRYVDEVGAAANDGTWLAEVDVTWRLEGVDRGVARVPVLIEFNQGADGLRIDEIAKQASGGARAPMWLVGPVSTARAARIMIVVAGDGADAHTRARELLEETSQGVDVVRATLADWDGRVVVEEAATAAGLDAALAAGQGTYGSIAAVTAAVDGSSASAAPVRVFLNLDVMRGMDSGGRRAVIAHELTHVATGAHRSVAEPWLVEGFADWVALRETVSVEQAAKQAIEDAQANGLPEQLPGPEAFASNDADLQVAYEQAWLVCRSLAGRLGTTGLVRLYAQVDSGEELDVVLAEEGTSRRQLLSALREELRIHL